jgi:protein-S-isoprenylcysteine O-methyltransferase Ste14
VVGQGTSPTERQSLSAQQAAQPQATARQLRVICLVPDPFDFDGSLALLTGAARIFLLAILSVLLYQVLALLEERELRERFGRRPEA